MSCALPTVFSILARARARAAAGYRGGSYDEILKAPGSLTGRYLSGELRIQLPQARRKPGSRQIKISGAGRTISRISIWRCPWECWSPSRESRVRENRPCCMTCCFRPCRPPSGRLTVNLCLPRLERPGRRRFDRRRHPGGPVSDGALRARIRLPTSRPSTESVICFVPARGQEARLQRRTFSSISPVDTAKLARATAPSPWRCNFSPMSN